MPLTYPLLGSSALMNLIGLLGSDRKSDTFRLDPFNYFPNYPGDPLDVLLNPQYNLANLASKSGALRGIYMNLGINPNTLPGFIPQNRVMQSGGFATSQNRYNFANPSPAYAGFSGLPNRPSYPTNFVPYTPLFTFNQRDISQEFKPGPGFEFQSNIGGSPGRFGISPLINAPNPQQVTLEQLLATMR